MSTLGGCGGLERTDFLQLHTVGWVWRCLKELIFLQFLFWEVGVVVLKELILTVSTLGDVFYNFYDRRCGGPEGTNFFTV